MAYARQPYARTPYARGPFQAISSGPAAAPFIPPDLPNPRAYQRLAADFLNSLSLDLYGQDQFFGAAGQPPANLDWPNPRGHRPREGFVRSANVHLIGQDTFYGAPGEVPAHDWPNQRASRRRHGYIQPTDLGLLSVLALPFALYDWPTRRRLARVLGEIAPDLVIQQTFPEPFSQLDWPRRARGPRYPTRDDTWPNVTLHLPQATPFAQLDWPRRARGPRYPVRDDVWPNLAILRPRIGATLVAGYPQAPINDAAPLSLSLAASAGWLRTVVTTVNNILRGKLNVTLSVTLAANATSTIVTDARVSARSALLLSPLTAHAAAELAAGTLYVASQQNGQATIAHANNGQLDRQFTLVILG